MAEKDIVERLRQTAHDFELHDPQRGVTYTGRCDVEAIREAADLIDRLRSPSGWRDTVIEQCAKAAHEAAGQFMSNSDRYVMEGPSGLVRSMIAAVRALKSPLPQATEEREVESTRAADGATAPTDTGNEEHLK